MHVVTTPRTLFEVDDNFAHSATGFESRICSLDVLHVRLVKLWEAHRKGPLRVDHDFAATLSVLFNRVQLLLGSLQHDACIAWTSNSVE